MRLVDWILRRRRDDDLQDEMRAHLSMATQDRIDEGEDARVARLTALKEFGNVTLAREATRLSWGGAWRERVSSVAQDVGYSCRTLARSPGYSLIMVAVLALGIGANVEVFSAFKALALKPIPGVQGSASLAVLVARTNGGATVLLSHPDFLALRENQQAFAALAGTRMDGYSLGLGNRGERVFGEMVTGNYFSLLGVRASRGRTLLPSDDVSPGKHPVVVIADGLWKRVFASDPAIVGKTIQVNAYPLTVVGVAEPAFHGSIVGLGMDLFVPVMMQPQLLGEDHLAQRLEPMLWGLGRLRSGISAKAAGAEAELVSARLDAGQPQRPVGQRATILSMWRSPFGAQTYLLPTVLLLSVMGGLLLVIVCANLSNLVLVRGISRRGEIAARLALGASRGRILRLLFIEAVALAVPGAALGLLTAQGISMLLRASNLVAAGPAPSPFIDTSPDWTVVVFAVLVSFGSSLVFGFIPALRTSRVNLAGIMKDDLSPRGGSRGRVRHALVVAQVAVSLLLLVGTGLVLRSLDAARAANTGFDERNVASITVDVKPSGYDEPRGRTFYQQLLETLRAEPGIESASLAARLPLSLVDSESSEMVIDGRPPRQGEDRRFLVNTIAPDYFKTLRIGLVAGRDFERADDAPGQPVAIVNETMARRFWGSPAQALAGRLTVGGGPWRRVIGVARDIKYARVTEDRRPYVYLPFEQAYSSSMTLHVRSRRTEAGLVASVRSTVQKSDANLPILSASMLSEQTRNALFVFVVAANTLMVFGVIAMILTALGTYGLVSYAAKQSAHEIGIRMAIGASGGEVLRTFLGRGLTLGLTGAVCGLLGSVAITRVLASLLYGVSATDVVSFSSASAAVMAIVLGASLIPAWRASRTDPITALRHR